MGDVKRDHSVLHAMFDMLADFPANGRPDDWNSVHLARHLRFIEGKTEQRQCSACGSMRDGETRYRITPAGQAMLELFSARKEDSHAG